MSVAHRASSFDPGLVVKSTWPSGSKVHIFVAGVRTRVTYERFRSVNPSVEYTLIAVTFDASA
jgi:hypothetical protein